MARWVNEKTFDGLVGQMHGVFPTVPVDIIKGVMATESGFNPNAIRGEPQRSDASRGLMQLLLSTARGIGYGGTADDLFRPEISLYYGTKLLADLYSKTLNWPDAISAYNGGLRPHLGFGRRTITPVRVCLRWSQKSPGVCEAWQDVKSGEYANQAHVGRVLSNAMYFQGKPLASGATPAPKVLPFLPASSPSPTIPGMAGGVTLAALLLTGLLFLGRRERRRVA